MSQTAILLDFLNHVYSEGEPIFLSDIIISEMSKAAIRQQMKMLTEAGIIKRYDTGIYFLPDKSLLFSESTLSINDIITKKYLLEETKRCGYISGLMFANQLGITTQIPSTYEICTNKATTKYRETELANYRIIIHKPYVEINESNATTLQFMDLLKEIPNISELEGPALTNTLINYMHANNISVDSMRPYLPYYPDRIYKIMFEVNILHGLSA